MVTNPGLHGQSMVRLVVSKSLLIAVCFPFKCVLVWRASYQVKRHADARRFTRRGNKTKISKRECLRHRENRLLLAKTDVGREGMDWEFGISRFKLLGAGRKNNKVLLCSTGVLSRFSRVRLFVTPWTGLPCPPPGHLPDPEIEPLPPPSPALAGGSFTISATWEALVNILLNHNGKEYDKESMYTHTHTHTGKAESLCYTVDINTTL